MSNVPQLPFWSSGGHRSSVYMKCQQPGTSIDSLTCDPCSQSKPLSRNRKRKVLDESAGIQDRSSKKSHSPQKSYDDSKIESSKPKYDRQTLLSRGFMTSYSPRTLHNSKPDQSNHQNSPEICDYNKKRELDSDMWYNTFFGNKSQLDNIATVTLDEISVLQSFSIGGHHFHKDEKVLGEGTHGVVLSYTSDQLKLAAKYFKQQEDAWSEKKLSERLTQSPCSLIQNKFVQVKNTNGVLFMEMAESLDTAKYETKDVRAIMEAALLQFVCLAKVKTSTPLYYTDLKPENILMTKGGRIALADLGSMKPTKTGYGTSYKLTKYLTGTENANFIHKKQVKTCMPYIFAILENDLEVSSHDHFSTEEKYRQLYLVWKSLYRTQKYWGMYYTNNIDSCATPDVFENWEHNSKRIEELRIVEPEVLEFARRLIKTKSKYERHPTYLSWTD